MFGLFKNKKKGNDLLHNWRIPIDASYKVIKNNDSWQFVNEDESRILYFSILKLAGDPVITDQTSNTREPSIVLTEHGWQLKGSRHGVYEILVCLFSFTNENDKQWAENLFADIAFIGDN